MTKRYDLSGIGSSMELGKNGPLITDNNGSVEIDGNKLLGESESSPVFSSGTLGAISLTVNVDPTKFDVSIDNAVFVDHTYGSATPLTYTGAQSFTAVTSPLIGSENSTFVGINSSGTLVYKNVQYTPVERRTIVYIGVLVHTDNVNISSAITTPTQAQDNDQLLIDLVDVIGAVNVSGNSFEPVDTSLALKKTAGSSFGRSVGYESTPSSPNIDASPEISPLTFFSNYRDATTGVTIGVENVVDPNFWDDGTGTLNALANNRVVAHRITYFASDDSVVIQYGQNEYLDMSAAESGYISEVFEERNNLSAGIFRGWLLLTEGITNLTAAFGSGAAKFIESNKFGGSASAGDHFDPSLSQSITGAWDFTQEILLAADPTSVLGVATKQYVDANVGTGLENVTVSPTTSGVISYTGSTSGTHIINLTGDGTLTMDDAPITIQPNVTTLSFFVKPAAHVLGFSGNIDWGDAGLPDLTANKLTSFTLISFGNSASWLGTAGNSGYVA